MKQKIILLLWLLFGLFSAGNAQDIITLRNGEEVPAKVEEVGLSDVKYKKISNLSGPSYVMPQTEIFMIKYPDGGKDMFEQDKITGEIKIRHIENPNPVVERKPETVKPAQAEPAKPVAAQVTEKQPEPVFNARKGTFDIVDLLENDIIEVETRGDNITNVNVRIRRKVKYPVTVQVPVGSYFVSANPSAQNMVATASKKLILSSSEWFSLSVPAACANRPKDIPGRNDKFTVTRSPNQEELIKLMPVLNKANATTLTKQAAVWIITDNADYGDLGILVSNYNARAIGYTEAAQAMKICSEAGIDITKKNIWKNKETIVNGLSAGALKTWLAQFGVNEVEAVTKLVAQPAKKTTTESSKSNGMLEILGVHTPDSVVFKISKEGMRLNFSKGDFHVYLVYGENNYQATMCQLSEIMGLDFDGSVMCIDKTIICAIDFGVPNTEIEPPSKIKFEIKGEEMYYDIVQSKWDTN